MCPNDSIYIGEWVMAIGNPFGAMIKDNRPTVTMGVVSAVGREFTRESGIGSKYKNMIQTDAAINPGNSGGALINCYGELIGINTFIFTQNNSGSVGVGFAIPAERVRKTLKEVIRYGKIRSFYTGISVQDIDQIMAQSLGLDTRKGVIVNNIEKRSPGAKAGLKVGDVILHVNQYEITNSDVIAEVFNQFLPGDKIRLEIMRGKKRRTVTLKLESKEQERTGQGK
jgi:S1-C subfamily serine protease